MLFMKQYVSYSGTRWFTRICFYLTFLLCLLSSIRSSFVGLRYPYIVTFAARYFVWCHPPSPPLHTIHYTLWNSVHIECKLPINCSRPIFRCADRSDVIHAVQYIRTTKTQATQYSTRNCSNGIQWKYTQCGPQDEIDWRGIWLLSPSGVGGLPLRREITCILLT